MWGNNMDKISVVMSVYNGDKYIKQAIDSILIQSYKNFELIIVDDGSTDRTVNIIENYSDERIKLYKLKENKGVGYASRYAVEKAEGKYIAKADSDDIYHIDRLLLQKQFLDINKEIALVDAQIVFFAEKGLENSERFIFLQSEARRRNKIILSKDIKESLYHGPCITHSSIMIRKEVLKQFNYRDFRIAEDYDLYFRLNEAGYKMQKIEKILTEVRVSSLSITASTERKEKYEVIYKIKKEYVDLLFRKGNVYLWGASEFGKTVVEILCTKSLKIEGFIDIDKNKQGKKIKGFEIFSPDILDENSKVIVTSLPGKEAIVRELNKYNYKHLEDYIVFL